MTDWISITPEARVVILAVAAVSFVGTLVAIPLIVARIRADYFVEVEPSPSSWAGRHPALRILWTVLKNALGLILVLLGIVLSLPLVPGQGLLTILMGLMLLDFPGKRRMELWMIRRNGIAKGIAWIRRKAGREPLIIPGDKSAQGTSDLSDRDQP